MLRCRMIDSPLDSSPIKNVSVVDAFDETAGSAGIAGSAGPSGDDHSGSMTPRSASRRADPITVRKTRYRRIETYYLLPLCPHM